MKTLVVLAIAMMVVAPGAWAQSPGPAEQELIALENDWSRASMKRDPAGLQRFYADDYIYTDSDGFVTSREKEIADLTSGAFRLTSYKFEDMRVRLYGNVAVVTGQNTIKGTWEGVQHDMGGPYRFTDVFVKRNGQWRCVASQTSHIAKK